MNTDWYDLLFHTSFTQSYNLSVSGGSDRVNYYISAGYNDQKGVANRKNTLATTPWQKWMSIYTPI